MRSNLQKVVIQFIKSCHSRKYVHFTKSFYLRKCVQLKKNAFNNTIHLKVLFNSLKVVIQFT